MNGNFIFEERTVIFWDFWFAIDLVQVLALFPLVLHFLQCPLFSTNSVHPFSHILPGFMSRLLVDSPLGVYAVEGLVVEADGGQ